MPRFSLVTAADAPAEAKPILENARDAYGFVPNLYGIMASSPALLEGYTTLNGLLENTALEPAEVQAVLLSVSVENGCDYCVAAHSAVALQAGLDESAVAAIRDGRPVDDERIEAIRSLATDLVRERGWLDEDRIARFESAGFQRRHVLDVVLGVGMKTLSNYTNHLAGTPLDDAFEAHAWERSGAAT